MVIGKEQTDCYNHPNTLVKFSTSEIHTAFQTLTGRITDILATKDFKKLRRACYQEIRAPTSTLPESLVEKLKPTKSLDDMLDVLALSPYWNWFDTRLLQAPASASGSPEAEAMLEQFKQIYYARKVNEVLPCVVVGRLNDSISFIEKFNKDPKELTLLDLLRHKHILEYEVMEVAENKIVLSAIKTGCVEIIWQVPVDLVYCTYTSVKKNCDKLASLAIGSLVCSEADQVAGLPILWRGQEVGEVGPIEPLPKHVRQEPYSLPQGFHWVNLDTSNAEEIEKFVSEYHLNTFGGVQAVKFHVTHPNAKKVWQFGMRAITNRLVGVVLTFPVSICVGKVSLTCIYSIVFHHKKYQNKRLWYMLIREAMRRANLSNIYHSFQAFLSLNSICKPVTTITYWEYHFDYLPSYYIPSSPRTPGWRRMTLEDVPSALAFINKWSSQFEIRQVFNSEEEFAHLFLSPTVPNNVFTYIVENETRSITDIVRYSLAPNNTGTLSATISTMASTKTAVKQLIVDAIVSAKDHGAKYISLLQLNIKSDILLSLLFQKVKFITCCFFNYYYPEVPQDNVWFAL